MDVADLVGQGQHDAGGQCFGAVEAVGVGDEVPHLGIAPDDLRDALQGVSGFDGVLVRNRPRVLAVDGLVVFVKIG